MKKPQKRAFTLVEILVTLALFVIIMTIMSSILSRFLGHTNRMVSTMSAFDGVRIFATQMTRELGSAMVRVNTNRWLNMKVEETDERVAIFFTAPDDNIRSIRRLNFVSHYVYYWDKEDLAVYRGVYNTETDPDVLLSTASDVDNKNREANQKRLTAMTLAYRSGSPYGWTSSKEMTDLMEQDKRNAVLRNVFDFNVLCYRGPKADNEGLPTWSDHTNLPHFVEFEIFVSADNMVGELRRELAANGSLSKDSRDRLRRFVITVPLSNHGINDNTKY